jgi:hypothetical protein
MRFILPRKYYLELFYRFYLFCNYISRWFLCSICFIMYMSLWYHNGNDNRYVILFPKVITNNLVNEIVVINNDDAR